MSELPDKTRQDSGGFQVVGIGASAGGVEAFTQLLTHLPIDTGMAFVLLSHLSPTHESKLADILSRVTQMPVTQVKNGMRVEPNCIYVLPPTFSMGILNRVLTLRPRVLVRGVYLVIDSFFQFLADDQKNLAIGVVLSGTGSDGTQGLKAIKSVGGITFAQDPKSVRFSEMPQNAIASGSADFTLSLQQIAEELGKIARRPKTSGSTTIRRL
jgi:two-component system CheB/CheR fusion protein